MIRTVMQCNMYTYELFISIALIVIGCIICGAEVARIFSDNIMNIIVGGMAGAVVAIPLVACMLYDTEDDAQNASAPLSPTPHQV